MKRIQKNFLFFSLPFRGHSFFNDPNSFPDLEIWIKVPDGNNLSSLNNQSTHTKILAHKCFISNASSLLKDNFEYKSESQFAQLILNCSNDFEAMYYSKAIKSIYSTITIEPNELFPMYSTFSKLEMKAHLYQLTQLWILECENSYSSSLHAFSIFSHQSPEELDQGLVKIVLISLGKLLNDADQQFTNTFHCKSIHPAWILSFLNYHSIISNPEQVLVLINNSINMMENTAITTDLVENMLRRLFCKLGSISFSQVLNLITLLSSQDYSFCCPCLDMVSHNFKLEMIQIILSHFPYHLFPYLSNKQ